MIGEVKGFDRMKRELSKIGELATYVNGYAFKPSDWSLKGLPIIRIQDLTGNDYQTNYYEGTLDERYKIKKGDLLISWSASIGIYEWDKEDAWLNQHIFKVVFDKDVVIDKKYFQYAVGNALQKVSGLVHGSTMKHLTKGVFDGIQVPLYSIGNQQEIVQRLETIQRSIELAEREKQQLDALVKSRFIEMFGDPNEMDKWPCRKVKDVADVTVGLVIKPTRFYTDDIKNGIKAFRSLNVREMRVNDSDWVYFSKEGNDQNKKSQLQKGDVLIVRSGYPGTSCVVTDDYEGCNAIDIIIARPKQDIINPYYLCAFNNYPHGMNQILHGTGGAAQKHFNVGAYNNVTIPLPPKEEQNKFVEFMQQADKSKSVLQKLLEKQELLRAALMQEYFG